MKETIKIERFLKVYEDTFESQKWLIESEGYSRLNEYTLYVSSDFGDYPDLIGFEAEILTVDRKLIDDKIKNINSICDKLINDFDFIMSNRNFKAQQDIGITAYHTNYLTLLGSDKYTKKINFDDNDLVNTVYNIKSIIQKLNQSDKDKPELKPQRTIKVDEFKTYFKPSFFGVGNGAINYFEWLIDHLQQERSKIEFTQIALMIFESNKALKTRKKNFSEWYRIFCDCVGCDKSTYKPNDLKPYPDSLTKLFNYL